MCNVHFALHTLQTIEIQSLNSQILLIVHCSFFGQHQESLTIHYEVESIIMSFDDKLILLTKATFVRNEGRIQNKHAQMK